MNNISIAPIFWKYDETEIIFKMIQNINWIALTIVKFEFQTNSEQVELKKWPCQRIYH